MNTYKLIHIFKVRSKFKANQDCNKHHISTESNEKRKYLQGKVIKMSFRFIDDVGSFQADDKILEICIDMYGDKL